MEGKKVNVVVADDHKLVCVSLGALLKTIPFVNQVHLAHNGKEALAIVRQHPIDVAQTTGDLHDRLSAMGAALIVQTIAALPLPTVPQSDQGVTYAQKIDKAEARVDFSRPAVAVDRLIRGLSPAPGAWCLIGGERVKLLRSELAPGQGFSGQVLEGMTIACGSGAVRILEAQREGKRPAPAQDLLHGFTLPNRLD